MTTTMIKVTVSHAPSFNAITKLSRNLHKVEHAINQKFKIRKKKCHEITYTYVCMNEATYFQMFRIFTFHNENSEVNSQTNNASNNQ